MVEPPASDSPHVPISNVETTKNNDNVMCLDSGEDLAPTTGNASAFVEEIETAKHMHANMRKICKKFD